jgi:hypothetical protein
VLRRLISPRWSGSSVFAWPSHWISVPTVLRHLRLRKQRSTQNRSSTSVFTASCRRLQLIWQYRTISGDKNTAATQAMLCLRCTKFWSTLAIKGVPEGQPGLRADSMSGSVLYHQIALACNGMLPLPSRALWEALGMQGVREALNTQTLDPYRCSKGTVFDLKWCDS